VCAELSAISRECVFKDLRDYVVLNSVDWDIKFSFVKLIISLTKRIVKKKKRILSYLCATQIDD